MFQPVENVLPESSQGLFHLPPTSENVTLEKVPTGWDVVVGPVCLGDVFKIGRKWGFRSSDGVHRGVELTRRKVIERLQEPL